MTIKAVFFDMGGTLVRDVGLRRNFVEILYAKLSDYVEIERRKLEELFDSWDYIPYRSGEEEYWDLFRVMLLLKKLNLNPNPRLVNSVYQTIVEIWVKSYVFEEDAIPTIKKLKEKEFKVGIISNTGSYDSIYKELEKNGLLDYVDVVVASQAVVWKKPSPKIFKIALDMLEIEPSEAIHVGDNPVADVEGAKKAGLWAVQKLKKDMEVSPFADFVVEKISEILKIVESLTGKRLF